MAVGTEGQADGTPSIANSVHSVDALVFDKDGTLLTFRRCGAAGPTSCSATWPRASTEPGDPESLGAWIGWDAERHRHDPAAAAGRRLDG
jgi:phosphoglycolate phosphatase-like HAD superfamily hydrolase